MPPITVITDEVRERMIRELTGPGGPFEVGEEIIRGIPYRTFKIPPRNLKEMYRQGTEKGSFYAQVLGRWFGDRDFEFIVYQEERYTFGQTLALAARLAWRIRERYGIRPGDRVALAMRNYPEFCIAFMAVTAMGAVAVPLNAWWEGPELEYGLDHSEPRLVFADPPRAQRMIPFLQRLKIPWVLVRSDKPPLADEVTYEDLMAGEDPREKDFPPEEPDIDADAYIMYTSGSTGRPKGVVATHRALITTALTWQFPAIGLAYLNRDFLDEVRPPYPPATLLPVPLFHVTGLMSPFLSSFGLKRKMVMLYKWDPEEALRLIEKERVAHFSGVPTMTWELVNSPRLKEFDTSSLTVLSGGGAARPPHQVKEMERLLGRHIAQAGYGLTETTALGALHSGESYLLRPDSVGRPSPPLVEAKIVDSRGRTLKAGEIGEICFKSPANMKEYWKDPRATAEVFLEGGWLKTGDVGLMDEEGYLYIKDRAKDMVIRGGENIACKEVEDALYEHPKVFEAAVFGLPEARLGEQVAAVVMVRPGESLREEELREHLKSRLAQFKIPSLIWIQKEPLPRGATDKIHKKGLKEQKLLEIQNRREKDWP
jgi:acyl-CoA synthetase (AMP-forming)/AMP-acid ligase II